MQATPFITPSPLRLRPSKSSVSSLKSLPTTTRQASLLCPPVNASAAANDNPSVDYSSVTSVFPAEACETLGGEACEVNMYPEVKLKQEDKKPKTTEEKFDREYIEYNNPKTVFLEEACDDLGGEFCATEYLSGAN
ncbi:hypothetical protein Leryth_016368 [Lithospermum erythrorhizon]|nr:hypothetical protein Leryth_016368 [Lithospermum erythrorhizon]